MKQKLPCNQFKYSFDICFFLAEPEKAETGDVEAVEDNANVDVSSVSLISNRSTSTILNYVESMSKEENVRSSFCFCDCLFNFLKVHT